MEDKPRKVTRRQPSKGVIGGRPHLEPPKDKLPVIKPERFICGKRYRLIRDFHEEYLPIIYDAKKGDILIFNYPGLGRTSRFYKEKWKDGESALIIMDAKIAFKILVEA